MKRIFIVVEGETEERFLRKIVYPHFALLNIHIEPQQWVTNRKLGTKGGGESYDLIENHIKKLISRYSNDNQVFISTMIDLYAFPKQGKTVYDNEVLKLRHGLDKVVLLEKKMKERFSYNNFIPYVQLHEFESLILSEPDKLEVFYPEKSKEIEELKKEISGKNPEEINETPQGAPSERIIKFIPKYKKQKTTAGVITSENIGLTKLRQSCPHFNNWLNKLEAL